MQISDFSFFPDWNVDPRLPWRHIVSVSVKKDGRSAHKNVPPSISEKTITPACNLLNISPKRRAYALSKLAPFKELHC
jgi:hypothetical protein